MKAYDAIRSTLDSATMILTTYLGDFSDADLLVRPAPEANHTAWQLGHLISSEFQMMEGIAPGKSPKLPVGFAEAHTKESAKSNEAQKFHSKKTYLELHDAQRKATLHILESLSESDLDKPGPEEMREWAPTIGAVLNGAGTHVLMHVGQIAVVRRKLGKPVVM